jgi:hypothetical protein
MNTRKAAKRAGERAWRSPERAIEKERDAASKMWRAAARGKDPKAIAWHGEQWGSFFRDAAYPNFHDSTIESLAIAPDGSLLLTATGHFGVGQREEERQKTVVRFHGQIRAQWRTGIERGLEWAALSHPRDWASRFESKPSAKGLRKLVWIIRDGEAAEAEKLWSSDVWDNRIETRDGRPTLTLMARCHWEGARKREMWEATLSGRGVQLFFGEDALAQARATIDEEALRQETAGIQAAGQPETGAAPKRMRV